MAQLGHTKWIHESTSRIILIDKQIKEAEANYGKKNFCGKQKLCKTILDVIQFS